MTGIPSYLSVALFLVLVMRLAWMTFRWRQGRNASIDFDGERVDVAIELSKGRTVTGVTVAIPIADRLRFQLVPESQIDRVAKSFGVAREWQTGDAGFDEKIFILSEDTVLLEKLSAARELRAMVLELIGRVGELECNRGKLSLTVPPSERPTNPKLDELRPRVAGEWCPRLKKLREQLLRISASDWEPNRDPARRRQLVLSNASAVCGLLGAAGYVSLTAGLDTRQVVHELIWNYALWSTASIATILLGALFLWLRATPYTHSVLFDVLLAAIPGAWFASAAVLGAYNVYCDTSPAEQHLVHVDDAYSKSGKGGPSYYLVVHNWPDARGIRKIRVSKPNFAFMHPDGCVLVTWHRGRLGDGWVSGYQPADCDREAAP